MFIVPVRSSDSTVGVSDLLLGRVDVGVSVVDVSELILSAVLGSSWGNGSCDGGGDGGGISSGVSESSVVGESSGITESSVVAEGSSVTVAEGSSVGGDDSCVSAGDGDGENNLENVLSMIIKISFVKN
jgi:hypothetical protein